LEGALAARTVRQLPVLDLARSLIYLFNIHLYGVTMETAKLFWSGRSQAVRLPKDFRLEGKEVRIRRHGASVILEPIAHDWAWLDALTPAATSLDRDFVQAVTEQPQAEEQTESERLFG
jgi:antitoxin VapB